TATDAAGNTLTDYAGTVQFTSQGWAVLPEDYTFTAADQGVHTFSAILRRAGTQWITALNDPWSHVATGTLGDITVTPAAGATFTAGGFPSLVTAGVAGSFTVAAYDPYGNLATGYTGTVHFTSSDAQTVLPADYTFTAADAGWHSFSATLKTPGTQSLTATDL